MLEIRELISLDEKIEYIKTLDPVEVTYLVPDLTSKSEVQRQFISQNNLKVLEEDSVLRANELWNKLFKTNFIGFQTMNTFFFNSYLQNWVKKNNFKLTGRGVQRLASFFKQLITVLPVPANIELLTSWLKENPSSYVSWGRWFEVSNLAWDFFIKNKLIPQDSLIGFLCANKEKITKFWSRTIIVDLSSELSQTEAELLSYFSATKKVILLVPPLKIIEENEKLFTSYKFLRETHEEAWANNSTKNIESPMRERQFKRFSTVVSEVKDMSSQVSTWLQQGVAPHEVAIVAPNVEKYWPIVEPYLKKENVPVLKPNIIIAQSLPSINRWLVRLRLSSGKISKNDIEYLEFSEEPEVLSYEEFSRLFKYLFQDKELGKNKKLKERYLTDLSLQGEINRESFTVWALKHWVYDDKYDLLPQIFNQVLTEVSEKIYLSLEYWIDFLEQILAKKEVFLAKPKGGVQLLNLNASSWLIAKKVFVLGLNDGAFSQNPIDSIPNGDVLKIFNDCGIAIDLFNVSSVNFLLFHLDSQNYESIFYSFPETSLTGEIGAPVLFWQKSKHELGEDCEKKDVPRLSRWDSIQCQEDHERHFYSKERIQIDMGQVESSLLNVGDKLSQELRLSASSLQRYITCPFIFWLEKLIGLRSFPEIDFDENPMDKGRLLHAIVEDLVDWVEKDPSEEKILELIELARKRSQVNYFNSKIWEKAKKRYLELGKRFLQVEKQRILDFPQTTVKFKEKKLNLKWKKSMGFNFDEGYDFVAIIDRVDEEPGGDFVIYDYKNSSAQAKNYSSWLKSDSLQMPLYWLALEKWLEKSEPSLSFAGAFFYVLKDLSYGKGVKVEGNNGTLYDMNNRRNVISEAKEEELKEGLMVRVDSILESIESGEFRPKPKKIETCNNCDWRLTCRASHLN